MGHMKKHTISYASFFMAMILYLSGCSAAAVTGRRSMEPVAVLDYVVPTGLPSVMTDLTGYSRCSEKYAYLRFSEEAGKTDFFRIRNMDLDRIVYEGAFEPAKGNDLLLKADFSDIEMAGRYRLECDIYGCSEEFTISDGKYESQAAEMSVLVREECRDLSASPETVLDFLQAYEWYGANAGGDDENGSIISDAPDELLAVRDWISGKDKSDSDPGDAVVYAAILAKFSFLYKDYDSALATECLQKASSIFSQSTGALRSDPDYFRALTELYRASGESVYYESLSNYKDYFSSNDAFLNDGYMYGAMTYIVTRQVVDKELCDMLVNAILSKAQSINSRKREITDPMYSQTDGPSEMTDYLRTLMCANYILKGYEYDRTIQLMMHFLSGLNVESSVFDPGPSNSGIYCLAYSHLAQLEAEGKLYGENGEIK